MRTWLAIDLETWVIIVLSFCLGALFFWFCISVVKVDDRYWICSL